MDPPQATAPASSEPAVDQQPLANLSLDSQPVTGQAAIDTMSFSAPQPGISEDEIALYDRQIRLWGVQAQEKMRNANVLLITMKALANEIAKNLVLAGIGSLTIVDHEAVTENDLGAQFFVSEAQVGLNRAEAAAPEIRKLNPRVVVTADTENIEFKMPNYYRMFEVVIATDLPPHVLNHINTATRLNSKPFYAAGVHGFYGFIFSDLIQHDYVVEREKGNRETVIGPETRTRSVTGTQTKKENGKTIELVSKRELYSTWLLSSDAANLPQEYLKSRRRLKAVSPVLSCLRALWAFQTLNSRLPGHARPDLEQFTSLAKQKHEALSLPTETLKSEFLRSFLQNVGSEIAPVTAVLGGQLAQDVINVLGQRQQPIQNFVFFNGESMEAPMYPLHPEGELGAALLTLPVPGGVVDNGMIGDMSGMGMLNGGMLPNMPMGMPDMNALPSMAAGVPGMPSAPGPSGPSNGVAA